MSDEERRILEREARYSERLTAFLACMRDGHVDMLHHQCSIVGFNLNDVERINVWPCARCGIAYWTKEKRPLPLAVQEGSSLPGIWSFPSDVGFSRDHGPPRCARCLNFESEHGDGSCPAFIPNVGCLCGHARSDHEDQSGVCSTCAYCSEFRP